MKSLRLAVILSFVFVAPALAQQASPASSDQPIEITATKSVEWLRDKNQYVAREDVIVVQGEMTLYADLLTADYRDGAQSSSEIYKLTAEGNVRITDGQNEAKGDKVVYDVPTGVAVMTGNGLQLTSPEQTVTARDRLEYHSNERYASAIGSAKVIRASDTLTADTVTAYFNDARKQEAAPAARTDNAATTGTKDKAVGGGSIERLEATGNVTIKTPSETITGQKAVYRSASNMADMTGNVKITRDQNVLEGARAEVNLTTNVSKMFGSGSEKGRVRGVFFPGSEKKGSEKTPKSEGSGEMPSPVRANAVNLPQNAVSVGAQPKTEE